MTAADARSGIGKLYVDAKDRDLQRARTCAVGGRCQRRPSDLGIVGGVKRQEKADRIGVLLDELYPEAADPAGAPGSLHAAGRGDVAQTTDAKVNEVTPALFAAADTPEKMATLGADRIRDIIRTIGLAPSKARNLALAAAQIVEAGGEVLPDWEFLESLAGVGHKTASVVMARRSGAAPSSVCVHGARRLCPTVRTSIALVDTPQQALPSGARRRPGQCTSSTWLTESVTRATYASSVSFCRARSSGRLLARSR